MFKDIQQLVLKELEAQKVEQSILDKVQQAKTLAELEITPTDAIAMLENNGITPVLDDSDRTVYDRPRNYQSKADLIAVRKTDVIPVNNRISTQKEDGVEHTEKVTLDGKEYEYSYPIERNTIHFAMNGEVASHEKGNWEHDPYAILQPFAEIKSESVASVTSNDTYTRGGVNLTPNAWILCPANEVEKIKKQNSNIHVLGYVGKDVKGLVNPFLSQLGYRAEKVGEKAWEDSESNKQFNQLLEKEHLSAVQHYLSTDCEDEEFLNKTNKAIAITKMLSENHLIQSPEDYERLKPQLAKTNYKACFYHIMNYSSGALQEKVDNTAIIANHRNIEVLSEKMAHAGMPLEPDEIDALQEQVTCPGSPKACAIRKNLDESEFANIILLNSGVRAYDKENQYIMGDVTVPQPSSEQNEEQAPVENLTENNSMVLW
ncbi:MAG: hypothetical protein J5580_03175 [Clostridia bacterium]|nr:hypothetical protein [Clostridia bacterium]